MDPCELCLNPRPASCVLCCENRQSQSSLRFNQTVNRGSATQIGKPKKCNRLYTKHNITRVLHIVLVGKLALPCHTRHRRYVVTEHNKIPLLCEDAPQCKVWCFFTPSSNLGPASSLILDFSQSSPHRPVDADTLPRPRSSWGVCHFRLFLFIQTGVVFVACLFVPRSSIHSTVDRRSTAPLRPLPPLPLRIIAIANVSVHFRSL